MSGIKSHLLKHNGLGLSILALTCIGMAYLVFSLAAGNVKNEVIRARIKKIEQRPNVAEDGYYGIYLEQEGGKKHFIDATGYINTPLDPAETGEKCVKLPNIQEGDVIEFVLPRSDNHEFKDAYVTCYKKSKTGYFIKLI